MASSSVSDGQRVAGRSAGTNARRQVVARVAGSPSGRFCSTLAQCPGTARSPTSVASAVDVLCGGAERWGRVPVGQAGQQRGQCDGAGLERAASERAGRRARHRATRTRAKKVRSWVSWRTKPSFRRLPRPSEPDQGNGRLFQPRPALQGQHEDGGQQGHIDQRVPVLGLPPGSPGSWPSPYPRATESEPRT